MAKDTGTGAGTVTLDDEEHDDDEQVLDADGHPVEKDDEDEEFDKDRAIATIKKQRENEKKAKADLAAVRKELKEIREKDLPDKDRLTQANKDAEERAERAEGRVQKLVIRTTALEAATALGFKNPTLAARLLDADEIEWDDDEPTNIKDLLRDILKDSPELKGRAKRARDEDEDDDDEDGADGGTGRRSKAKGFNMSSEIRRAAGRRG